MITLELPRWLFWLLVLLGPPLTATIGWGLCAIMTVGKMADLEREKRDAFCQGQVDMARTMHDLLQGTRREDAA